MILEQYGSLFLFFKNVFQRKCGKVSCGQTSLVLTAYSALDSFFLSCLPLSLMVLRR